MEQLEGRNPVLECLARGRRRVHRIWLDEGARPDDKITRILELAERAGVILARVPRARLDKMADGRVHNGIVAHADPVPSPTARQLLDTLFDAGRAPFLLLADEVSYEHNLGAILRTSLGFGVDGLVIPTRRGAEVGPVVQRVSMGAVEVVPVVREGLSSALKPIRDAGIPVVGADMGGTPLHASRLSGPLALVLGGEGKGLSPALRRKCDAVVSVPLAGKLESLNVSVAAGILMYEKRRQDGWFDTTP
ncbi:MAG: 23S rRNA (guanosine(2251)-2'-O)-methyltransferase RlmB [Alphaproteobacteria bacterium]|nr:23S rRNA (guanosine(2251)-2'-O)-methyltransferase RlmB [Alphaproteobacteria bacterium]